MLDFTEMFSLKTKREFNEIVHIIYAGGRYGK